MNIYPGIHKGGSALDHGLSFMEWHIICKPFKSFQIHCAMVTSSSKAILEELCEAIFAK